jgi:hypothetical protein
MPGPFALTLETPALATPAGFEGPITAIIDAVIQRGVAHAGDQVTRGWRATLRQERRGLVDSAGAAVADVPLLWRGKVLRHTPVVDEIGQTTLVLDGETWTGQLTDVWIQTETTFTSQTLNSILGSLLTPLGIAFSVPARCMIQPLTVTFSDLTILAALIRLAELTKTNLRDGWGATVEFTDQYNLPNPAINLCADDPILRVVQLESAGRGVESAGRAGFAIVGGAPSAQWDGTSIANKVKVIGADFDGSELTLEGASYPDSLYTVQTGTGPSADYFYVEDTASIAAYGPIETQIVRSDLKGLSNVPLVRDAARAALLAIANGELLRRRSPILTFNFTIANGEDIFCLPGDVVHLRYKGWVRTRIGVRQELDIDAFCLVYRRGDRAGQGGVRIVNLDLVTPELPYEIPDQPDWHPVPTPNDRDVGPQRDPQENADDPAPEAPTADPGLVEYIMDMMTGQGQNQPCCADPTTDAGGNPDDYPGDGIEGPRANGPISTASITPGMTTTNIATVSAHGLTTGQSVRIGGVSGLTPDINGYWTATVIDATHFTIAVAPTGTPTPGTVQRVR